MVLLVVLVWQRYDPVFHGKRESVWMEEINNGENLTQFEKQQQIQLWWGFGSDGLKVLEREFRARRRRESTRKIYAYLNSILPITIRS